MNGERRVAGNAPGWRRIGTVLLILCLMLAIAPVASFAQTGPADDLEVNTELTDARDEPDDDAEPDEAEIDAELEELGVTGSNSYESPQFGFTVEWSDPWELDLNPELDLPVTSDDSTNPPSDSVRLTSSVEQNERLYVTGYLTEDSWLDTGGSVPREHVEQFEAYAEGDELEAAGIESIDLLLSDYDDAYGAVLYVITWDDGDVRITHNQIQEVDDFFIESFISVEPALFNETFQSAAGAVEVEGEPVFNLLDEDDVAAAVEAAVDELVEDEVTPTPAPDDNDGDEEDEDDTGESTADAESYLAEVREQFDTLTASHDRFFEIINGGSLSEAEADEINATIQLWLDAPGVAGELDVPDGFDDLHDAYLAYTGALADSANAFIAFVEAEPDSAEAETASTAFQAASDQAMTLAADVEALLAEAGA